MAREKKQRKILPVWLYLVIYIGVIVVCVALDQLTKMWVFNATHDKPLSAPDGGNWWTKSGDTVIPIIGNWLTLDYMTNDGATGGLFRGKSWLFFAMTLVGVPIFCWLLWRSRKRSVWGQIAFSLVIGGTLGNACDRLFLAQKGFFTGEVRDFVHVSGFFGVFNFADSCLVVGVIMALLAIIFFDPDSLLKTLLNERNKKVAAQSAVDTDEQTDGAQSSDAEQTDLQEQELTQDKQSCDDNAQTGTDGDEKN